MPHLPESARLWLERAEIDYIGPFIKAWASINAWYRHTTSSRKDVDGLRYLKQQPNPVRNAIMPMIQPARKDGQGNWLRDDEAAHKFKLLIRDLHVCLDSYHIEVARDDDVLERISFRSIFLGRAAITPQTLDHNRMRYRVDKSNRIWKSTVCSIAKPTDSRAVIEQALFDVDGLRIHFDFIALSSTQQATLLALYQQCNPRPLTDLLSGPDDKITAGDIEFHCTDQQLFSALVEIIYGMRNALLHGELQPHELAFAAYEPAYRIVMRFLDCLRS
jgi:hypothetical protein